MIRLSRPCLAGLTAALASCFLAASAQSFAPQPQVIPSLPPSTAGPARLRFAQKGLLLVALSDLDQIALIQTGSGEIRTLPAGGRQPHDLIEVGEKIAVANRMSGTVSLVNMKTGRIDAAIQAPGEPSCFLQDAAGRLWVTLPGRDELAEVDTARGSLGRKISLGRRPTAAAMLPDGRRAVVANLQGGDVSLIDLELAAEIARIPLTGVNLRDISVTPDGSAALVTGQIAANSRATREPLDIWTNSLFRVDLNGHAPGRRPKPAAEGWLDFSGEAAPDPDGVAALGPDRAAVAAAGSDEILLVETPGPHLRTYDPRIVRRAATPARPRALALSPDGRTIWVSCELAGEILELRSDTLQRQRTISLPRPRRADLRMAGRYLFGSAGLTSGRQFSCSSCHPDGRQDGLTWEFAHVPDEIERRNTRSLRGGVTLTAPFRWSGHDADIELFVQEEITGLLKGPPQQHAALHQFWNLLDDFPLPPNPYRQNEGTLHPAAERGAMLFRGKAACAGCHRGELYGGSGLSAYAGTTPGGRALDVPHLAGLYDSPPYLHDGRARNLEEVFGLYNSEKKHGAAHRLTDAEKADLIQFLKSL